MTTIAYPVEPELPGWGHSTVSLLVGWLLGAAALVVLYVGGSLVGAISQPYGSHAGVLNEWPYGDNGLWSMLANCAVIAIALVLTTVATSWWLRRRHAHVSDGRLAFVLLFTGWIPLALNRPLGGFFGFCVAVVLIRCWVGRHDDRLTRRAAAVLVAMLGCVVLSYGLLHPLWTTHVVQIASAAKARRFEVTIHNAARVAVTVDRVAAESSLVSPQTGRLHVAAGTDGSFFLSMHRGNGCGTAVLSISTQYRLLGLTLRERLPVDVPLGPHC